MKNEKWYSIVYSVIGICLALLFWVFITSRLFLNEQFSDSFSPLHSFRKLWDISKDGTLLEHTVPSLKRVAVGLGCACLLGIPMGIFIGFFTKVYYLSNTVIQFVRMTSPLAWMPIAIILLGVGDKPIYFLITIAAVWPIVLNTAQGVRNVDQSWIQAVRMLGGGQIDIIRRVIIPAVIPDILTGIRISIGISWIILVPAEMLGVSSGLGYFILDTRDRFEYGELMAAIVAIGFLGYITDYILRLILNYFSWRTSEEQ